MKKKFIIIFIILLVVTVFISVFGRFFESLASVKTVEDYTIFLLKSYTPESDTTYDNANFGWNTEGTRNNWTYFNGMMMYALAQEPIYMSIPRNFYYDIITEDGKINNSKRKANVYNEGELDSIMPARTIFMINYKENPKFEKALDYSYNNLKKQAILSKLGNNYIHKSENKLWERYPFALDGLYMALPFYAEYTNKSEKLSKHDKNANLKIYLKK